MTCRLFVAADRLRGNRVELDDEERRYLLRVRRLTAGAPVIVFDGAGREGPAELRIEGEGRTAALLVSELRAVPDSGAAQLIVLLPLIKGDRTEWAIQKLVELGVNRIIPVRAERCVVRLDGSRAEERVARYRRVARAAAQQSRRATLPTVEPVHELEAALALAPAQALKLMLWPGAGQPLDELHDQRHGAQPEQVWLLVGPEGGLTGEEADAAVAAGFAAMGLGPRILRAETAAVAAAAVLGHRLGDLR